MCVNLRITLVQFITMNSDARTHGRTSRKYDAVAARK